MIVADALKIGIDPLAWIILPRIELGPLAVSPHGIGIALGYLLGAQAMVRRARRVGGPDESLLWNALFWALFGAIPHSSGLIPSLNGSAAAITVRAGRTPRSTRA